MTQLEADIAQMKASMDAAIAADRYPEEMVLRDVKLVENEYGCGGAFSDVLPGRRGAVNVAVKTPRLHAIKIEGEDLRKVSTAPRLRSSIYVPPLNSQRWNVIGDVPGSDNVA